MPIRLCRRSQAQATFVACVLFNPSRNATSPRAEPVSVHALSNSVPRTFCFTRSLMPAASGLFQSIHQLVSDSRMGSRQGMAESIAQPGRSEFHPSSPKPQNSAGAANLPAQLAVCVAGSFITRICSAISRGTVSRQFNCGMHR